MNDREALERSMEIARRDAFRAEQLDDMLAGSPNGFGGWWIKPRPWDEVARFAAMICQGEAMNLAPFEPAPTQVNDENAERKGDSVPWSRSWPRAAELVKRLKAAGISKYHPDPIRALAEAER